MLNKKDKKDITEYDRADNRNNGLITKVWGSSGWTFGHAITFGYPLEPTAEQKKDYENFFRLFGHVLPCKYCRESYGKFITEGDTILDDKVLENRRTLSSWFYNIHEAVNKKLGVDYGVTYEDLVNKYESFRAKCGPVAPVVATPDLSKPPEPQGCVAPLDYKAYSYKRVNRIDCPILDVDLSKPFILLARIRQIDKDLFKFYRAIKKNGGDYSQLKGTDLWTERTEYCRKQIVYMRESAIPSIETEGEWADTPTIDELKLLVNLSSNLSKKELALCTRKLMGNIRYLLCIKSIN